MLASKNFAPTQFLRFLFQIFRHKTRVLVVLLQPLLAHGESPDVGRVVLLHGDGALAPRIALKTKVVGSEPEASEAGFSVTRQNVSGTWAK